VYRLQEILDGLETILAAGMVEDVVGEDLKEALDRVIEEEERRGAGGATRR
jgi:DNA-binding ferritin-like protein (Dps family)